VTYRDSRGRERIKRENRIDSWFIGFAPVSKPRVAFAVVVEGGGYGARTSAPIAFNLLLKAQSLGLLGDSAVPTASPAAGTVAAAQGQGSPPARRPTTR